MTGFCVRFILWVSWSWNLRSFLAVFLFMIVLSLLQLFISTTTIALISFLNIILYFHFSKISSQLMLLRLMFWDLSTIRIKFSSGWSTTYWWSRRFLPIKSSPNKLLKCRIHTIAKRNKLKEIIKILIRKYSIIDTLKLAIRINCSLEGPNFRSIPERCNYLPQLDFPFLLNIQHIE